MESWKRKLRMGMVGGGQGAFIGAVHRMAAALDQQIELVAGCFSQDPKNTEQTGKDLYLDPARCYGTYKDMAAAEAKLPEDKRIDLVSIVTPNVSHFPIAQTFLEAGFHVVCDKPMTRTLDEARELVEIVEKTGLVFALTHNYTGYPLIRHARELFRSGQIGEIRKVIVEYLQDFLMVSHEKMGQKQATWRVDPALSGVGGTLGDIGTHCANLLEYVTGDKIEKVCADKSAFLPDRKLDDDVNALIRLHGGGKGVISVSQVATGQENGLSLRVFGSEAGIKWAQENPNRLEFYQYGKPTQILTRAQGYLSEAAGCVRIPPGHPEGFIEAFATIYDGVVRAVRRHIDGNPIDASEYEFPSVHDGLRGMQFIYSTVDSCSKDSAWTNV